MGSCAEDPRPAQAKLCRVESERSETPGGSSVATDEDEDEDEGQPETTDLATFVGREVAKAVHDVEREKSRLERENLQLKREVADLKQSLEEKDEGG